MEIPPSSGDGSANPPIDGAVPWPVDEETRSKLVDSFLLAGVFGHDSAIQVLDSLTAAKILILEHEKLLFEADIKILDSEIQEIQTARQAKESEVGRLKDEAKNNRAKEEPIGPELAKLESERSHLLRGLLSKRLTYPVRLLQKKHEAIGDLGKIISSLTIEEETQKLEHEKVLHKLANERRSLNKEEYDRRRAYLADQRSAADQQFRRLDDYLEKLRFIGITRTTAGFMVWAGYIAFTAFGWLTGEIIQRIVGTLGDKKEGLVALQQLVETLASILRVSIAEVGLLLTAILVLIAPLVPTLIIFGLFWLADKGMRGFDPRWIGKKASKAKEKPDFSPWPQTVKVTRADYAQALGRLPFLYIWLLVPLFVAFLFTFSGRTPDGRLLSPSSAPAVPNLLEPVDSFVYAFLGVVLCIVVASFSMLYSTRVIEIRSKQILSISEPVRLRELLRLNIELVILLALFILVVIGPDLVGLVFPIAAANRLPASLWVLLLLNGITVSSGLIYRGHFRDHAALRKEMDAYGDEMDRYSAFPVVEISEDEVNVYQDRLAALRKEIDSIWRTEEFFSDPFDTPSVWSRWVHKRRTSAADKSIIVPVIKADELLEPELIGEVGRLTRQIDQHRAEQASLQRRQQDIESRLATFGDENWSAQLESLNARKRLREQDYWNRVADLSSSYFTLVSRCRSAMSMGGSLREGIYPTS